MGYPADEKKNFEGGSWVWVPKIGIRKSGDITFYAGQACALPDNGPAVAIC